MSLKFPLHQPCNIEMGAGEGKAGGGWVGSITQVFLPPGGEQRRDMECQLGLLRGIKYFPEMGT